MRPSTSARPCAGRRSWLLGFLVLLAGSGAGCGAIAEVFLATSSGGGGGSSSGPSTLTPPTASFDTSTPLDRRAPGFDPIHVRFNYRVTAPSTVTSAGVAIEYAVVPTTPGTPLAFADATGVPPNNRTQNLPLSGGSGVFTFVWDVRANLGSGPGQSVKLSLTPSAGGVTGQGVTSDAFVVGNASPTAQVLPPNVTSGFIPFTLHISDAESDTASLEVSFLRENGNRATATAFSTDLTQNLATSPGSPGAEHFYIWNSRADLPQTTTLSATLFFRARDFENGPETSVSFILQNNLPPTIAVEEPRAAVLSGAIPIGYTLFDDEADSAFIVVQYSDDSGRTFRGATPAARGTQDGTQALTTHSTTNGGAQGTFVWDSTADLGPAAVSSVHVRITPFDSASNALPTGNAQQVILDVDNTPVVNSFLSPGPFISAAVADLDADGEADLLGLSAGTLSWQSFSPDDGGLVSPSVTTPPPSNFTLEGPVTALDVDGDGRLDAVAIATLEGSRWALEYTQRSSGRLTLQDGPPGEIRLLKSDGSDFGSVQEILGGDFAGGSAQTKLLVDSLSAGGAGVNLLVVGGGLPTPSFISPTIPVSVTLGVNVTLTALARPAHFLDASTGNRVNGKDAVILADGTIVFGGPGAPSFGQDQTALLTGIASSVPASWPYWAANPPVIVSATGAIAAPLTGAHGDDAVVAFQAQPAAGQNSLGLALVAVGPFRLVSGQFQPASVQVLAPPPLSSDHPNVKGRRGYPLPVVGDFNGDGLLDVCLIIAGANQCSAHFFIQKQDGTFAPDDPNSTPLPTVAGNFNLLGAAAADLTGSGKADAVALTDLGLLIFRRLHAHVGLAGSMSTGSLTVAPIGPAHALGITFGLGNTLQVYEPANSFGDPVGGSVGLPTNHAVRVRAADVTGDGFSDLVLQDQTGALEVAEQGRGHRVELPYTSATVPPPNVTARDIAVGCLSGSARDDVYTAAKRQADSFTTIDRTVQQSTGVVSATSVMVSLTFTGERLIVRDLVSDPALAIVSPDTLHADDLVAIDSQSTPAGPPVLELLHGEDQGLPEEDGSPVTLSQLPHAPVAASCILSLPTLGGQQSVVLVSTGDATHPPTQTAYVTIPITGSPGSPTYIAEGYVRLAVGDLNGDGIEDVVGARAGGGLSVLLGKPDGTFDAPVHVPAPADEAVSLAVGDLDGDGHDDIFVASASIALVYYQSTTLSATLSDPVVVNYTPYTNGGLITPPDPVIADVNGDGAADLILGPIGTVFLTPPVAFLHRPDGLLERTLPAEFGPLVNDLAVGDFDGDGVPDIALLRSSDPSRTPNLLDVRLRRVQRLDVNGTIGGKVSSTGSDAVGSTLTAGGLSLFASAGALRHTTVVSLGPADIGRTELRTRLVPPGPSQTEARRLRISRPRLPPGTDLAGPPVFGTPEFLPVSSSSTQVGSDSVVLNLPVAPGVNLGAPGRVFTAYRVDRVHGSGPTAIPGTASNPFDPAGSTIRTVSVRVSQLGLLAVGLAGNTPPSATVTAAGVLPGTKYVTIRYSVSDADGDFVRPVPQYKLFSAMTGWPPGWTPCSTFDAKLPPLVPLIPPQTMAVGQMVRWDALRDLGPGTFNVQVRVVPRDVRFGTAVPFTASVLTLTD